MIMLLIILSILLAFSLYTVAFFIDEEENTKL